MDVLQQFPQYAWAALSLGLIAIIFRLIAVLAALVQSFARQPIPATQPAPPIAAPPKPVAVPVPPAAPPAPSVAPPPPVLTGPFAGAPPWFLLGLHDLGFHEVGDNQGIDQFIADAHAAGAPGDPWCAFWVNAKLEDAGIPGTRSASSQSFRTHPNFVPLAGPALGCIVVYWRTSRTAGVGHVGFYVDETAAAIRTLGGNESDMVQIEALPKDGASFGLVGYFWPKSVPLPKIGAIPTPAGSLAHVIVDPTAAGAAPAQPVTPHPLVDQTLIDAVKGFEGFSAKAYGDFKQYSIGYGTVANSPTEVITEAEAEKRLVAELSVAATSVDKFAPNLPVGVHRAMTDFSYNLGTKWHGDPLGQLIQSGAYEAAKPLVLQYNHAGGQVSAGLTKRREAEVSWFDVSSPTAAPAVT